MQKFNLSLAGMQIALCCRHEYAEAACKAYITQDAATILLAQATEEEIQAEILAAPAAISQDYAEFICLYRKIAEQLPRYGCSVMHGAAIAHKGAGILFMAPSGTGKSTHIKLWEQVFGAEVDIINGDKPIVSIRNGNPLVHGTPWAGKEGWHKNCSVPLKALCILRQAPVNRIKKADPQLHLPELMRQLYLPKDPSSLQLSLQILDQLITKVPLYILECNMLPEAATVAFNGMMEAIK